VALTILSVAFPLAPVRSDTAGGAEQVLLQLDSALVAAGHRSVVVASEGSEISGTLVATPRATGTFDDPVRRGAQQRHARAIEDVLRRCPVDVVHMHGVDFHAYLPPPGIRVLVTLHLPLDWYPPEALRPPRPDTWLHCVSSAQHETWPCGSDFLPPIANGVAPRPAAPRASEKFALFLGRICPEKGVHLAIDAAKRAGLPLIVAGAVFPYESHTRYFDREIAPRLGPDCRFIGNVGPAARNVLLSEASCVLLPSLCEETSSLVAREALASGTPVIAFPRRAFREIVEHGRSGFIVEDVAQMSEAIPAADCIDRDSCRRAAARFPLSRMIQSYFAVYERLARHVCVCACA
jgi:glycosyltransferase involved in cell wall biosynthesis